MAESLPLFSGAVHCRKCDAAPAMISVRHCPAHEGGSYRSPLYFLRDTYAGEVMERRCGNCHFVWFEVPLA